MLRLSLRRWCAARGAAASAGTSSLPSFYGKSFTVSPRTWRQITEKNTEEGFANDARYLRLAIDSGGCHGYLYKFSFEPNTQFNKDEDVAIAEMDAVPPSDETFTGARPSPRVVVDSLSASKLENAVLDFHSELKGSAFVVVGNELVDQSCACAMSFSLKKKTSKGAATPSANAAAEPNSHGTSQQQQESNGVNGGTGNARPITRRSAAARAAS